MYRLQISLLILGEFKPINQFLFFLKSSENLTLNGEWKIILGRMKDLLLEVKFGHDT